MLGYYALGAAALGSPGTAPLTLATGASAIGIGVTGRGGRLIAVRIEDRSGVRLLASAELPSAWGTSTTSVRLIVQEAPPIPSAQR